MHSALLAVANHITTIMTHQTADMLLNIQTHTYIAYQMLIIAVGMLPFAPHTIRTFHNSRQQIGL